MQLHQRDMHCELKSKSDPHRERQCHLPKCDPHQWAPGDKQRETKLFPPRILLPATASQIQIHCKHCLRLLATASDSHHMAWEAWNNFKIKINSERRTWAPTPTFTIEATRICACTQRCSLMTISQIRSASTEANHLKRSNLRSPQQWEKASLKYIMYSKDTRAGNPG